MSAAFVEPLIRYRTRQGRKTGYTLVEMLLAIALSAALLASLWTLFDTYTELFNKGQAKVENSQLCRALMQQIADDLHAAIQDPVGGSSAPSEGSAPVRRFGLSGSAHALRFDVLQVIPQQGNPAPVGQSWSASGEASEARVPELRTIYYSFTSQPGADGVSRQGLVRRELDFETPVVSDDGSGLDDLSAVDLLAPESPAGDVAGDEPQADDTAVDPTDDSVMWVPEVRSVAFRYFDGHGWTSSWDSLERKSLPVAVEVVLQIADSHDASKERPGMMEKTQEQDAFAEEEEIAAPDTATPQGTMYRLIVDLPGSPTFREPRPPERPVAAPPAPPASRPPLRIAPTRIAPRRFVPAPKTKPPVRIAPEEWIRTQSR